MRTLLLNKTEVGSLIDLDGILLSVEKGYAHFSSGKVVQPDFINLVKPGTHTGFDFKTGYDLERNIISVKSSSGGYADNPAQGLPTGLNMVYLYDGSTSVLKCIMDGTWITGCRTAAAGAISVKYLARKNATKLAMIGTGGQARRQLRAIIRVRPITEVYVFGYHPDHVETYIKEMSEEFGIRFIPCSDPDEAVSQVDIVVTTTQGRRGIVVNKDSVRPGTHIVAVGADVSDKQEIDPLIFPNAKVVNDSIALCLKNGDTHHAVDQGIISSSMIYGEIGEIILGQKKGRENEEEITIFDTVGMAIQDISMATDIYEKAQEKKMGTYFDFIE